MVQTIKSIELVDWKTHRRTKLGFQRGVNVIVGIMGAGKSSVLDAVSFALFGTFPALKSRRISLSDIISRGSESAQASVKLDFDCDGHEYTVTRTINRHGASSARLEADGRYMQTQSERVTEEIERLLKVDYDTFARVIYAGQNNLDYFLELTKGDRKRQIDNMLGLDQFAAAEENATALVNSVRASIRADEEALARVDVEGSKRQLAAALNEKAQLDKELRDLEAHAKAASSEASSISIKLAAAKAQNAKRVSLSKEIASLTSRMATLEGELAGMARLDVDEKSLDAELKRNRSKKAELEAELSRLGAEAKKATSSIASLESAVKAGEDRLAERAKLSDELRAARARASDEELATENAAIEELRNSIARANATMKELRGWTASLKKHVSKCPVCERDLPEEMRTRLLEEKTKLVASLEAEVSALESKLGPHEARVRVLASELTKIAVYANRLKDLEDTADRLAKARQDLSDARPMLLELEKRIASKTAERDSIGDAHARLVADIELVRRREGYVAEISKARLSLSEREAELASIRVDERAVDELQELLRKKTAEASEARSRLESSARLAEKLESQVADLRRQIDRFASMAAALESRRVMLSNLNRFKAALTDTGGALRDRLVSSINGLMQSVWPELYPYADYGSIRLTANSEDYLLEASIGTADEWLPIDAIASGGERSVACLAMRIAMAMVLVPNLKWLILDEPTHNLDQNGIAKLISVFGETLPGVVEQIFVITHDESLKQISSAKVYTLDRDKAANGPTEAYEL